MAGALQAAVPSEGPGPADAGDTSRGVQQGPLSGHPEASAGLHKAVRGLERQLATVLASNLTPLSEEVARLRERGGVLEAENRRLRELLEEAGLGLQLPPPGAFADVKETPAFRPQRRLLTQPGARRQRSGAAASRCHSPGDGSGRGEGTPATPSPSPGSRKPTLLASVGASAASPELRSPSGETAAKEPRPSAGSDHRAIAIAVADDAASCGARSEPHPDPEFESSAPEVDLQQIWKDMNNAATIKRGIFHRTKTPMKKSNGSFLGVRTENLERLILPPTSHVRILWEAIGAISIVYDLVTVPLQAFNVFSYTNFFEQLRHVMIYLHICYWTLDLPCSFFVGYYVNGVLETRVKKTAKKYLTSWFLVDICLVICDWIMFSFELDGEAESTNLSYLVYGRILRLLRFVRLVRLLKLHNMFNRALESIHSEYALTFMRVSEHLLLIICLNHFIACAWYWIGTLYAPHEPSWIDKFKDTDGTSYRYTTALHWSLTQFTPASMEVFPRNVGERTYNVVVVALAMVIFSTFISSITEAMTRLRKSNGLKAAQYQVLRQYLSENEVSMQLAMRIWRHLERAGNKARAQRKMWRDVELFREIPDTLQMDLHHEVYMPILLGHPFFRLYSEQSPVAMRAICHYATQEISLVSEQVLFGEGQVADKTFFVIEGLLEYQSLAGSELSGMWSKKQKLTYPDWLCEAVIWVKWFYHGTAVAKQPSSLIALNVSTLHSIMKEYLGTIPYNCNYAERFAEYARNHPTGMCDFEEDVDKIEAMAQEALEHVEGLRNASNPNPSHTISQVGLMQAPKSTGRRRVTWGRRSTLGTRRSGSSMSGLFSFLQGSAAHSSTSLGTSDVRRGSNASSASNAVAAAGAADDLRGNVHKAAI